MAKRMKKSALSVFFIFLRLGLTSFGGPVAHLSYFRDEFVVRRRWLSESTFADLVALCQFLPGPSSSQVGIALGYLRSGYSGAFLAWAGFTLPSALLLGLFAISLRAWGNAVPPGMLHGLKLVAVAVVAQAVWGMAKHLCTDRPRVTIAAASACVVLIWPNPWGQIGVIVTAALIGLSLFSPGQVQKTDHLPIGISRRIGSVLLGALCILLIALPFAATTWHLSLIHI